MSKTTKQGFTDIKISVPSVMEHCDPLTIKKQELPGEMIYWRGVYTYHCFPGASGERTSYRAITKGNDVLFAIHSEKDCGEITG